MKSFRQMIADGEVKRADAMKIGLDDLHEEPGFNLRDQTEEFHEGIAQFATYIAAGGIYPALEVRPRDAGGVFVVEGHRRRLALLKARDELGAEIEWVPITQFSGNDADRIARIMTSAEGRALTPLEISKGYKRLQGLGLSDGEIAAKVNKSVAVVKAALVLSNVPTAVQQMVAAGEVAATTAVALQRKHGDSSAEVLAGAVEQAKAAGKKKVTPGSISSPLVRAQKKYAGDLFAALNRISKDPAFAQLTETHQKDAMRVLELVKAK